ncbi:hypothetical protein L7F22_063733 [Adiantum nelumboides]|nr:hypothetical protein [Adiantum nelumboides]
MGNGCGQRGHWAGLGAVGTRGLGGLVAGLEAATRWCSSSSHEGGVGAAGPAQWKELDSLLSSDSKFVQPSFRLNEVIGWVKDGVHDFSISRAAVEWGIPVPTDVKQTIYVWFDALLGYVSALLPEDIEPTLENAFSGGWPASVHIIGKDILRFHAVYWPAMLMSAGFPLPQTVFGHGFLTKGFDIVMPLDLMEVKSKISLLLDIMIVLGS